MSEAEVIAPEIRKANSKPFGIKTSLRHYLLLVLPEVGQYAYIRAGMPIR